MRPPASVLGGERQLPCSLRDTAGLQAVGWWEAVIGRRGGVSMRRDGRVLCRRGDDSARPLSGRFAPASEMAVGKATAREAGSRVYCASLCARRQEGPCGTFRGGAEIGPSQVVLRFAFGTFVWIAFLAVQVGPGSPANDVAMDALDRILIGRGAHRRHRARLSDPGADRCVNPSVGRRPRHL